MGGNLMRAFCPVLVCAGPVRTRGYQRDLFDRGEVEVKRAQHVSNSLGVAAERRVKEPEDAHRAVLIALFAGQRGKAKQPEGCRRVAGGNRVIVDVLAPGDQLLMVAGRGEEPALIGIFEELDHPIGCLPRRFEPANLKARLVERQQGLDQIGVVLEIGVEPPAALLPGPQQPSIVAAKLVQDELRAPGRCLQVVVALQDGARLRESADRQRVPGGEALVVEPGPDPLVPGRAQNGADLTEPVRRLSGAAGGDVEDVRALEVAPLGGAEPAHDLVGPLGQSAGRQPRPDLVGSPDIELALLTLGVSVQR